jgi:hypothetical protein
MVMTVGFDNLNILKIMQKRAVVCMLRKPTSWVSQLFFLPAGIHFKQLKLTVMVVNKHLIFSGLFSYFSRVT